MIFNKERYINDENDKKIVVALKTKLSAGTESQVE